MGNKLYVGNLPYSYRDSDMEQAFSQYGTVSSAKVMMERDTGRSKGFGFVEMSNEAEAKAASKSAAAASWSTKPVRWNRVPPVPAASAAVVVAAATAVVAAAVNAVAVAAVTAAAVAAAVTKTPC
jgi:hypothetical protein